MTFLPSIMVAYSRSGLRGLYRLTSFFAPRLSFLQSLLVKSDYGHLWVDLRVTSAIGLVVNPRIISGEDNVMRSCVKDGDIVFDIGAHFGLYTLLFSDLVGEKGRVYAFEPNEELRRSLRRTMDRLNNVELLPFGLSDVAGEVELFVPEDASMASLNDWTDGVGGKVHRVFCSIKKLDDLVDANELPVPDFIKCDVEGAELKVFRGAERTLNRPDAPIIMFETNVKAAKSFNFSIMDYFDFLRSLELPRYEFFEVLVDSVVPLPEDIPELTNVVAIPASKLELFELAS